MPKCTDCGVTFSPDYPLVGHRSHCLSVREWASGFYRGRFESAYGLRALGEKSDVWYCDEDDYRVLHALLRETESAMAHIRRLLRVPEPKPVGVLPSAITARPRSSSSKPIRWQYYSLTEESPAA